MEKYQGKVIEFLYDLKTGNPRPIHESDLSKKFTDNEHRLFASGSDVVLISDNQEKMLWGYWEKRRDVSKIHITEKDKMPARMVTYAQVDQKGIPRITRASLSETAGALNGENIGWSDQTAEVMRRY